MKPGLIIDCFAGGGGASLGIEMALGRSPDIAINHDPDAIAMHAANHPTTLHLTENIWKVDPDAVLRGVAQGRDVPVNPETRLPHVSLLHASPDCRHHSKAKGGAPVSRSVRGLADVILVWARLTLPDVITLENVEEWQDWGPLREDGKPCPERKGLDFRRWCRELGRLGYTMDWRELRAFKFGAPTIRKRLYFVARRDGLPIWWPLPTRDRPDSEGVTSGALKPWRTAAEIIDWHLPCPSIFLTREEAKARGLKVVRPLAAKTMSRVARGFKRYVLDRAEPFIVGFAHGDSRGRRAFGVDEPHRTVSTSGTEHGVVAPLVAVNRFDSDGRAVDEPLSTVTANSFIKRPGAGGPLGVLAPLLSYAQQGGGNRPADAPHHTICANAKDQNQVIAPHLMTMRNSGKPHTAADEPAHTVTAGGAGLSAVAGYLVPRYGERPGQEPRSRSIEVPAPAIVPDGNGGSLAAAFLAQHNTDMVGHEARAPISTIVSKACTQAPVMGYLASLQNNTTRGGPAEPVGTVLANANHHAFVLPHLTAYYGSSDEPGSTADEPMRTATGKARFAHVEAEALAPPFGPEHEARARQVAAFLRAEGVWDGREADGEPSPFVMVGPFVVVDIGMRMLTARELARAQGFPESYDLSAGGRLTDTAQRHKIGNSVCPDVMNAILRANLVDQAGEPATPRQIPRPRKPAAEAAPMLFAAE